MARLRRCRFRNVLICLCAPGFGLALLLTYVSSVIESQLLAPHTVESPHFVATGEFFNDTVLNVPKVFWEQPLSNTGFWNQLQGLIDHHFNPILNPSKAKTVSERIKFDESLLKQSYFKSISMKTDFGQLPKQLQQFVNYMKRRDYPILIQPEGRCGAKGILEKEPPLIVLAIKTTELNFKNRQAIRQTWGRTGWVEGQRVNSSRQESVGGYVRRVFLLGKESPDELGVDPSALLKEESKRHGDILQWDFQETFFNLPLKDVLFWKWFTDQCQQAHFVFKGDDDVFVNTPKLITYLQDTLKNASLDRARDPLKNFMVGEVIGSAMPHRGKKSKYYIPENFYKGLYPMYAGGGGVLYSGSLVLRLYNISKTVHLYPIDDVYVGMCMIRLKALPMHHPAFLTFDFPGKEEDKPCSYHRILLVHKRSPSQVMDLWKDLRKTWTQCQHVPLRIEKKRSIAVTVSDKISNSNQVL